MLRRQWVAVVLLALVSVTARNVHAAPNWGSFAQDNCVSSGYRKYNSRLWNISGDWSNACLSTPARVGPENVYFESPDVCVDRAIGGVWGEFHVRDTTCDPTWGSFKDDGCRGSSGYRQYSSVLWDVQGSWGEWCESTPAIVRGIYFRKPTRCVISLNSWGEFDVYDPCCPRSSSPAHTELRRRLLTSCSGRDDEPPFPNPRKITSAADAVQALLTSNYDPLDLIEYLWNAFFQSLVYANTSHAADYYAIEFLSFTPSILRFQDTAPPSLPPYAPIRAMLIPTILGGALVSNGGIFPSGTFATINLGSPPAPIICTQSLTGCTMAFGWDNSNGRLYMGHVQPDPTVPAVSNYSDVANYLRTNHVFPRTTTQLTYREFFGRQDAPTGYYDLRVNIVGFISADRIRIYLQMADVSRKIVRRRMMEFRRE